MTWQEYYDALIAHGCSEANAANIVGSQMDLWESWDWDALVPFDVSEWGAR